MSENACLEKFARHRGESVFVYSPQLFDTTQEIDSTVEDFASGLVQYIYNECGKTGSCGREGGYSPFDKVLDPRITGPGSPSASGAVEAVYPEITFVGIGAGMQMVGGMIRGAFSGGANSVFWSGYDLGAKGAASRYGTILETTLGGRALDWLANSAGFPLPKAVWDWASATYARNATGTAQAVIRNDGRVWTTIEKPILQSRNIPIVPRP